MHLESPSRSVAEPQPEVVDDDRKRVGLEQCLGTGSGAFSLTGQFDELNLIAHLTDHEVPTGRGGRTRFLGALGVAFTSGLRTQTEPESMCTTGVSVDS